MSRREPTMRLHLWLENDRGVLCGQGRIQLLEYIAFTGSLSAAAKSLGIAYRAAWGKVKATEEALGVSLVSSESGRGAGTCLTAEGRALVAAYRAWLSEVEEFALQSAFKFFEDKPEKYHSLKDIPSPRTNATSFPISRHG